MMVRRSFVRAGYTFIEILVAVAVIGVLLGLAMPAISSVRHTAWRSQCTNNLRQIAHAALQHHDKFERLPEGVTMPYAKPATTPGLTDASGIPPGEMLRDLLGPVLDSPTRRVSDPRYPFGPNWAVYLLPYLDQSALYYQSNIPDYMASCKNSEGLLGLGILVPGGNEAKRDYWRTIVKDKALPVFRCPADAIAEAWQGLPDCPGPWARGNYAANAGPGWWQMSLKGGSYTESFGRTGPVMGINFGACMRNVPDGASTTVMLNEIRGGVAPTDPRGAWAIGLPGSSITASNAIGDCMTPNDRTEGSDDIEGCPKFFYPGIGTRDRIGCSTGFANLGWPSWQAQARSQHKEGVHAAFCDGSVRFVHNYVSQGVWFSMLSTRDGVPYSFN
jgi:prepilin-type N-terminal cleavage/methylation domain-containing protein/prepilin-type processing-associated H-X9-DG protein